MEPPYPSLTATWHNDTYPAIDPKGKELSQAGKTVVITGAGSGIGRATAIAFAEAGAKTLVLIGRTLSTLRETQELIPNKELCNTHAYACSVTDEAGMKGIADRVGGWDVLILNAGYTSPPGLIAQGPLDEFWKNYEANVKGIVVTAQAFIPTAKSNAAMYAMAAGSMVFPPQMTPYLGGYETSKIAQMRVMEFLAAENPHLFVCSVHPGLVDTSIFRRAGATPDALPMDTVTLPAHFLVWLSQPKTKFLNGKMVFANWDVDEMCAKAEEIKSTEMLTLGYVGWPFMKTS